MSRRGTLRRVHVWLGWLVGVPLLFWTASGLWMVARPIAEVRGTALRHEPAAIALPARLAAPQGPPLRALTVEMQDGRAVWLMTRPDGGQARADALTGAPLPTVDRGEAVRIARAAYRPGGAVAGARRFAADAPPADLRQPRPAWQVAFADGTNLYVDADTGRILALRTAQWRAFDWMWGLHIMDLEGREDTSHPVLIGFAALSLVTVLLALVLLPMVGRRRGRRR